MMTKVYTNPKKGDRMRQQYVAPSLEVLGSLGGLTLATEEKELGPSNDGFYLRPGHKSLQNVS